MAFLHFTKWTDDYYSMGQFCKKTNTADHAQKSLSRLQRDSDERRLFLMGAARADECTFEDIAFEMRELRNANLGSFNRIIMDRAGWQALQEINEAIANAKDWETDRQRNGSHDITGSMVHKKESAESIFDVVFEAGF